MNVRVLMLAFIPLTLAMSCATIDAMADTPAASIDADSAALFGSVKLSDSQATEGTASLDAMSVASPGAYTLAKATGNMGVNVVAGALNAQANQIAVVTAPQAEIVSRQTTQATGTLHGSSIAQPGNGTLAGASGNFGVNVAAGIGNAQLNAMIVH